MTVDDLIDVMEKKATEDILSLGGVEPGALDKPFFENPISLVVRKRLGWLLLLFVAEMFTGTVLRHYDEELAKVVALSFFYSAADRYRRQRRIADGIDHHSKFGVERNYHR